MSNSLKSTILIAAGVLLLLCPVVFPVVAWIVVSHLPREYSSKTIIEIRPDNFGLRITKEIPGDEKGPHFLEDQIALFHSAELLDQIVDKFDLVKKWSTAASPMTHADAVRKLASMIQDVKQLRNTDMLSVSVLSTDPQEAADIANALAQAYIKKRLADQTAAIAKDLAALGDDVEKQRKIADEAAAKCQEIRIRDHVIDPDPDGDMIVRSPQNVLEEEKALNEAKQHLEQFKLQLARLEEMSVDDLAPKMGGSSLLDPEVSQLVAEYQQAVADEGKMVLSGADKNDPDLKAVRVNKEALKTRLQGVLDTVKKSLQNRLAIAQDLVARQQQVNDDAVKEAQDYKAAHREYFEAKEKYLDDKKSLGLAKDRLETEKVEIKLMVKPAQIWEDAEPAQKPSSPNVPVIMAIATGLGILCVVPGVILLTAGLRLKRSQTV